MQDNPERLEPGEVVGEVSVTVWPGVIHCAEALVVVKIPLPNGDEPQETPQ